MAIRVRMGDEKDGGEGGSGVVADDFDGACEAVVDHVEAQAAEPADDFVGELGVDGGGRGLDLGFWGNDGCGLCEWRGEREGGGEGERGQSGEGFAKHAVLL